MTRRLVFAAGLFDPVSGINGLPSCTFVAGEGGSSKVSAPYHPRRSMANTITSRSTAGATQGTCRRQGDSCAELEATHTVWFDSSNGRPIRSASINNSPINSCGC